MQNPAETQSGESAQPNRPTAPTPTHAPASASASDSALASAPASTPSSGQTRARPPSAPLRIGLAGLGTVGIGLLRLLEDNGDVIAARAGRSLQITAVSARSRDKDRGLDLSSYAWEEDMAALAARADVDLVVEMVGGADGPALDLARASLGQGKHFVTANKAMIAHHGLELAQLAEENHKALAFEAAVAGGIPALKGLREGAAANAMQRLYGILNGTANYILSAMEESLADFSETLKKAQELGYAEADPSFDIEGVDAAHKLTILSAIAFGARPDFPAVACQGISQIRAADIAQADALGYVIRLVAMASLEGTIAGEDGAAAPSQGPALLQSVAPCLVPKDHPLAHVKGPTNAVVGEGNYVGRLLFEGAGAGAGPTASAVMADIIDIARHGGAVNGFAPPFGLPVAALQSLPAADTGHHIGRAYLRLLVSDRPGVLAQITAAMHNAGVSIESLIQKGRENEGGEVLVAMVTHEGPQRNVEQAVELLSALDSLNAPPLVVNIIER